MSNKGGRPKVVEKILSHPDSTELLEKLMIGIEPRDVSANLAIRYSNPGEKKFVISEKDLKSFKDNYLDMYKYIKEDLAKVKASSSNMDQELELALAIKGNSAYKEALTKLATNELDIKTMMVNSIAAVETLLSQIYNEIQESPDNINTRTARVFNETLDRFYKALEQYDKIVLKSPDMTIAHTMTITHIDSHIQVIQEALRETIAYFDVEVGLKFIEVMTEKLNKLNLPTEIKTIPTEHRLAEAKIVNEQINERLNNDQ